MKYYTGAENERSQIEGYPGDVWISENNDVWAARVGAAEVTKEQAQSEVNTAIQGVLDPETGEQIVIILP
jgi:hypothetical protein